MHRTQMQQQAPTGPIYTLVYGPAALSHLSLASCGSMRTILSLLKVGNSTTSAICSLSDHRSQSCATAAKRVMALIAMVGRGTTEPTLVSRFLSTPRPKSSSLPPFSSVANEVGSHHKASLIISITLTYRIQEKSGRLASRVSH